MTRKPLEPPRASRPDSSADAHSKQSSERLTPLDELRGIRPALQSNRTRSNSVKEVLKEKAKELSDIMERGKRTLEEIDLLQNYDNSNAVKTLKKDVGSPDLSADEHEFGPLDFDKYSVDVIDLGLTSRGTPRIRRQKGEGDNTVQIGTRIPAELAKQFNAFVEARPYLTKSAALEQAIRDLMEKVELNQ